MLQLPNLNLILILSSLSLLLCLAYSTKAIPFQSFVDYSHGYKKNDSTIQFEYSKQFLKVFNVAQWSLDICKCNRRDWFLERVNDQLEFTCKYPYCPVRGLVGPSQSHPQSHVSLCLSLIRFLKIPENKRKIGFPYPHPNFYVSFSWSIIRFLKIPKNSILQFKTCCQKSILLSIQTCLTNIYPASSTLFQLLFLVCIIPIVLILGSRSSVLTHAAPVLSPCTKCVTHDYLGTSKKISLHSNACVSFVFNDMRKTVRLMSTIKPLHLQLCKIVRKLFNIPNSECVFLFDSLGSPLYSSHLVPWNIHSKIIVATGSKFGASGGIVVPKANAVNGTQPEDASELLDDKEYRDETKTTALRVFYSNVRGGMATGGLASTKKMAVKAASNRDDILAITESNCSVDDAVMLANVFGKDARVAALDQVVYDNFGKKHEPVGERKKMAFGTCIIAKNDDDISDWIEIDNEDGWEFEIVAAVITRGAVRGVKVCAYRNPRMTIPAEIIAFYNKICSVIKFAQGKYSIQFVLVCMDDNKSCSTFAKNYMSKEFARLGLRNLIGDQPTRYGKNGEKTQPDTVWGWNDPIRTGLTALVGGRITEQVDHCAIKVVVDLFGVEPRKPTYRNVVRMTRVKDDDAIAKRLDTEAQKFCKQFRNILAKRVPTGADIDQAMANLRNYVKNIKNWAWQSKTVRLPDVVDDKDDKYIVEIGHYYAKLQKIGLKLQKNGKDEAALRDFATAEEGFQRAIQNKLDADCDRDLEFALNSPNADQRKFRKWADQTMSKFTFKNKCESKISPTDRLERLRKHDETFVNNDPNFVCKMSEMAAMPHTRRFSIDQWDPELPECDDDHDMLEFIKSRKKIDSFYKIHAEYFAEPLFVLLKLMEAADYFPIELRTIKATFINGPRTIFSLEAVGKILEGVLTVEFTDCLIRYYDENGHPGGFAYTPGRGVESCMCYGLTEIEVAARAEKIAPIQVACDLKKAFNSTPWDEMVKVVQTVAGAGKLMQSRQTNRMYTHDGELRHHGGVDENGVAKGNRGECPGAPLSVFGFDVVINSDHSTTRHNKSLLCCPNYSDDRNITCAGSKVESGEMQLTISCDNAFNWESKDCDREDLWGLPPCAYCWAKRRGMQFHETGKKAPDCLAFCPTVKGEKVRVPEGGNELMLASVSIPIVDRQKTLGLSVATHPRVEGRDKNISKNDSGKPEYKNPKSQGTYVSQAWEMIAKNGYFLEPDMRFLTSAAYRLQQLKDEQTPVRIWKTVMGHYVGKLRFCSALYWCRTTKKQMNTVRFYYAMAASAIIGLNACQTVGANCCKNLSVAEGNASMERLLKFTGLPSLRQIAEENAVTVISQMLKIDPKYFSASMKKADQEEALRKEECEKNEEPYYPRFCSKKYNKSLVHAIWKLGMSHGEKVGILKKKRIGRPDVNKFKRPFEAVWVIAGEQGKEVGGRVKHAIVREAFRVGCEERLGVLEENERQLACKTPARALREDKRCPVYPPFPEKMVKRVSKTYKFDCSKDPPQVAVKSFIEKKAKTKNYPCLVCGNWESESRRIKCGKCDTDTRTVHEGCLDFIGCGSSNFECSKITNRVVLDVEGEGGLKTFERRFLNELAPVELPAKFRCLICGEFFAHWDPGDPKKVIFDEKITKCGHSENESRACAFGVHDRCLRAHELLTNNEIGDSDSFYCSLVKFQAGSDVIEQVNQSSTVGLSSSVKRKILSDHVVRANPVKRYRRFMNAENMCTWCNQEIPRAQLNHLMQHCPAYSHLTPVPNDPARDLRGLKKRMYAIGQGRLKPPDTRGSRHGFEQRTTAGNNDKDRESTNGDGASSTLCSQSRLEDDETMDTRE